MKEKQRIPLGKKLDMFCTVCCALIPVGLVVGNVAFEGLIALSGLIWLIRIALVRDDISLASLKKHPLVLPWIFWFATIVTSVLINGAGSKGWGHDFAFVRYLVFGVALIDISGRVPIQKYLYYGLAAGVLWAALNTASAYLTGCDLIGKPLIRYTGKLKEASRISGMTAYAAPFFLVWGLTDARLSKVQKYLLICCGVIAFAQVFQTTVRTAILAATAGTFFGIIFLAFRRWPVKVLLPVIFIPALSVAAFFQYKGIWSLDSIYDRIYFWKVAHNIWLQHPVVGVGVSSFQDAYRAVAASGVITEFVAPTGDIFKASEQTHAHNLFFMLVSCTGVVGLLAFIWLVFTAIRMIIRDHDGFKSGLMTWPVALAVIGLTGFNIFHSWYQALFSFFLVMIGCGNGAGKRRDFIHEQV